MRLRLLAIGLALALVPLLLPAQASKAASRPNIFFYNLDDLRDAVPRGVDPLQFMPKVRQWMTEAARYTKSFITDPACCPSRAATMTGRYPHNNGVRLQSQGPNFDYQHSMACYLRGAGYSTYVDGKFLTSWPKTTTPPCFDHSTVMWEGYNDVQVRVDGVLGTASGYSTTYLGARGREYIVRALSLNRPFLLYEAPQAPHWVTVTNPDGTTARLAVPEAKYSSATVGSCSGPTETDRSDKPPYVRWTNHTAQQAQQMCQSQLRAIMTADDEFGATMQLLSDRGVLDNTLVIFSSDNGYMWGEHGRTEKFVPYEPSVRVPLLVRWPGHIPAGTISSRTVSNVDLLPTMLAAAGVTLPAGAPRLDGESLLSPSTRTTTFAEYYQDSANGAIPTWKMIRTGNVKYVHTYDTSGNVTFREYYKLSTDPIENTNLLKDGTTANDPPAGEITALTAQLNAYASCAGSTCVR
jgi:N-acetylglucosamine-6-sulfatase